MSLTSFSFFVFLLITIISFYVISPAQKYILLIASLYFYINVSPISKMKMGLIIFFVGMVTYVGAILIEKANGVWKNLILSGSVLSLVLVLFIFKYAYNVFFMFAEVFHSPANFSWLKFLTVIGISYYALSAIGYMVDVFWGNEKADRNIAEVFLFIFYFPQLISGPLTRFGMMRPQITERRKFDLNNIFLGMRRMAWGYFKKLVISERFAVVVTAIYGNYSEYSFVGIIGATLCYAVQLYTDFSGCMDIIMGASLMFGIKLPENFNAPFFSETIQEFWQRWHITLGTWFKDYLMFPLQKSKKIQLIGKWAKKKFGKKVGRKVPFYISMLVLWFLIGLWHGGTGYYFIASAGIPCVLLILSDLCQPFFHLIVSKFHMNTKCISWRWFRRIRTLLLICICWMVVCSNGTRRFAVLLKHAFSNLWNYTSFNSALGVIGLTSLDLLLMVIGICMLYLSDLCTYKGSSIFEVMDKQNYLFKIILIYTEVIMILMYGMVGSSPFIYFQF
mgnify:CR=1 FL=1